MDDAGVVNPIVVAPTFNNADTLPLILRRLEGLRLPVIIVNDGCTDATAALLQQWLAEPARPGDRRAIHHPRNRGKAAALASGFEAAARAGFTHAVTIDTDGQLEPEQIPLLLEHATASPRAIILGNRDARAADYPVLNRLGRWAANQLVRWESGARVFDSQCGFRIYPLHAVRRLGCRAERYAFETEVLTRAAWAGITIEQVPVNCTYPPGGASHFRPWRDSFRAVGTHAGLITQAFSPWRGLRLNHAADTGRVPLRLARWFSPAALWQELKRGDQQHRTRFAAAIAIGVFIGNLPVYGAQTLLCLYAARRLRLNPLPVILGCSVSTPPLGPALVALAIAVGHWCLHGTLPAIGDFHALVSVGYIALLKSVLLEWCIGSLICGTVLGAIAFVIAIAIMRWLPRPESVTVVPPGPPLPPTNGTPAAAATSRAERPSSPAPTDAEPAA